MHMGGDFALTWDLALILLLLGVWVPWRGARRLRLLLAAGDLTPRDRLRFYAATVAAQWAIAAVVLWRVRARGYTWSELGLALPRPGLAAACFGALLALFLYAQYSGLRRMAALPPERQGVLGALARKFLPQSRDEFPAYAALCITAGVCEEIIYRGFVFALLARVSQDDGLVPLAGSALLFGLGHAYQGRAGVFTTTMAGILFGAARLLSGSVVPGVIVHAAADGFAGAVAPRWLRAADAAKTAGAEPGTEVAAPQPANDAGPQA